MTESLKHSALTLPQDHTTIEHQYTLFEITPFPKTSDAWRKRFCFEAIRQYLRGVRSLESVEVIEAAYRLSVHLNSAHTDGNSNSGIKTGQKRFQEALTTLRS